MIVLMAMSLILKCQIIDVERIVAKSSQGAMHEIFPVVRTLYDHMEVDNLTVI